MFLRIANDGRMPTPLATGCAPILRYTSNPDFSKKKENPHAPVNTIAEQNSKKKIQQFLFVFCSSF